MATQWQVRRFRPEDRELVFDLYDIVHGKEKAAAFRQSWIWEYEKNPHAPTDSTVWIAATEDRVVGIFSSIPVEVSYLGVPTLATWSVDVMTHPDVRGQGVFKALTDRMLSDSEADGVTLFPTFPNGNSGPIMRRRGWIDIKPCPIVIKSLRIWPLLKKVRLKNLPKVITGGMIVAQQALKKITAPRPARSSSEITIRAIDAFDDRFDGLWSAVSMDHDFMVKRDQAYLNWRYVDCPHKRYTLLLAEKQQELMGYIVLTLDDQKLKNGYIVDFVSRSGDLQAEVTASLLREAEKVFRQSKAAFMETMLMEEPYRAVMENQGFAEFPSDVFWSYTLVVYKRGHELYDPDLSWFLTRGDADTDIAQG